MQTNPLRQPMPALLLAVALGILTHKANANAARSLGVPAPAVALLAGGVIAVSGIASTH
jgi:hypothetical protein